jgi:hypothetical protein
MSTRSMPNIVRMYRSPVYKWMALHGREHGWFPYRREPWHWEYNPPGFRERFESGAASQAQHYGAPVGLFEHYRASPPGFADGYGATTVTTEEEYVEQLPDAAAHARCHRELVARKQAPGVLADVGDGGGAHLAHLDGHGRSVGGAAAAEHGAEAGPAALAGAALSARLRLRVRAAAKSPPQNEHTGQYRDEYGCRLLDQLSFLDRKNCRAIVAVRPRRGPPPRGGAAGRAGGRGGTGGGGF